MPGIFVRMAFSEKHMTEVRAASDARDLRTGAVRVHRAPDGAGNLVIEAWPAAVRVEFVLRIVQRRFAAPADVGPLTLEGDVLPAVGHFGAFMDDNPLLFGSQGVELCFHDMKEFRHPGGGSQERPQHPGGARLPARVSFLHENEHDGVVTGLQAH